MRLLLFVTAAIATLGAPSGGSAQTAAAPPDSGASWHLVYATDQLGAPTFGTKDALLRAVRAGQPIRVGWQVAWRQGDGRSGVLEHVAGASFLTIHEGEVFAQLAPILGQVPSSREPVVELMVTPAREWYGLLDTRGWLRGHFVGVDSATSHRVPMQWYAMGAVGPAPPGR
jgi:hypothetical protein